MKKIVLLFLIICLSAIRAYAGSHEKTGFTIYTIERQFFSTPYESAGVNGFSYAAAKGTAVSIIQNPAALAQLQKPDFQAYYQYDYLEGEGGGVTLTKNEFIKGSLSDTGAYQSFMIPKIKGVFGLGGDSFFSDFDGDPVTRFNQKGSRVNFAWAIALMEKFRLGYGFTYLHDVYEWGSKWLYGNKYLWKHQSDSFRHRLGMQGDFNPHLRWGLQGDIGHGHGENRWNDQDTKGNEDLSLYRIRIGGEADIAKFTFSSDFEWENSDYQWGKHHPAISPRGGSAYYKGEVYRWMLGVQYLLWDKVVCKAGYRYDYFKVDPLCNEYARQHANNILLGITVPLFQGKCEFGWAGTYSWISHGDISNTISLRYSF